jgi:SNF2 family DNA or RNA helicase
VVLKDLIKPYLLRRLKADVDVALPDKKEQVMMCRLCPEQVAAYRSWIRSDEVVCAPLATSAVPAAHLAASVLFPPNFSIRVETCS